MTESMTEKQRVDWERWFLAHNVGLHKRGYHAQKKELFCPRCT